MPRGVYPSGMIRIGDLEIHHAHNMSVMRKMADGCVDAAITDPPYASGGTTVSARKATPRAKYFGHTGQDHPGFGHDQHDQRTHLKWSIRWMEEALRITRPRGWLMVFSDWRQVPTMSDALQMAGWVWRGVVVWHKPGGRPHKGMFTNSCEYILIATNGSQAINEVYPRGMYSCSPQVGKIHMTGKPIPLMRHLMSVLTPGSVILDPFAGSGSTLVAARELGHPAIGIEIDEHYYNVMVERLNAMTKA